MVVCRAPADHHSGPAAVRLPVPAALVLPLALQVPGQVVQEVGVLPHLLGLAVLVLQVMRVYTFTISCNFPHKLYYVDVVVL